MQEYCKGKSIVFVGLPVSPGFTHCLSRHPYIASTLFHICNRNTTQESIYTVSGDCNLYIGSLWSNQKHVYVDNQYPFSNSTWSTKQIPDYKDKQDALRSKGVNEVIILAVNDGAVMMNWAKSQKVGLSMLTFLGDPKSEFTRALVSNNE